MHAVKKINNSVVFQRTFSKYLVLGRYVGSYDSLASFSITRFKLSIFSSGEKDNTFGLVMMTLYLVLRWENIIVFCVYVSWYSFMCNIFICYIVFVCVSVIFMYMLRVLFLCYVLMFMIIKCFLFSDIIDSFSDIEGVIYNGIIIYSTKVSV